MITSDWLFNSVHLKTTQKKEYIISILRFTFIKAEVNYTCALLFVSVLGAYNTPSLSKLVDPPIIIRGFVYMRE